MGRPRARRKPGPARFSSHPKPETARARSRDHRRGSDPHRPRRRRPGRGPRRTTWPPWRIRGLVDRAGLPADRIEDVILGCANQAGEDNRNVARMAALLAGPAGRGPGPDREPPVRLGAPGRGERRPGDPGGRGRGLHRRRGGEHDPGALRHAQERDRPGTARRPRWRIPPSAGGSPTPRMPKDWTIALGETAERVATQYGITPRGAGWVRGGEPARGPRPRWRRTSSPRSWSRSRSPDGKGGTALVHHG